MISQHSNIKLKLSLSTIEQSFLLKKTLLVLFVASCIVIGTISSSNANNISSIEFENTEAVNQVRKIYSSPVKDLNKIINKTTRVQQALPVYSIVKDKSYINGQYSQTSEPVTKDEKKETAVNWLTNGGRYSKISNDPFYNSKATQKTNTTYEYNKLNTSVTTLRVNNKLAYDYEIIEWPDGTVSVPIKTLAELLDIAVEQNHVNNNISFTQPGTDERVTIDVENNKIIVGTNVIEVRNPKLIFLKEGFITKDDIYVPEQIARDLLDIKSNFEKETCVLDLSTSRVLKALVELNEQSDQSSPFVIEESQTAVVEAKKENKLFNMKQLTYNIGSSMNQSNSGYTSSSNSSANIGFNARGNLLGGEYNIGANTYYGKQGLVINGYRASLDYIRPSYELSLGATNTRLSELAMPGGSLWGVRLGSVGAAGGGSSIPRYIEGKADDNSYVEVFINDVYAEKQIVQNGRFQFDSLTYPGSSMVHIRVDQIGQDGSKKVVYDRKFSQDNNLLAPGQKQYLVFSGIDASGLSNSLTLFGNDQFNYQYVQPLKWVSGAKYRMGISDNLTMGVNVARDYIVRQPSRLILNNLNRLSSARVYRTGRSSAGTIISIDMDYKATENLKFNSEVGYSLAHSRLDPAFDPDGVDFGGFVGFNYTKPGYSLAGKVFSYGPDFYSAGNSGLIDRRGFELSSNWKLGKVNFNGSIIRYDSNLDNYFAGGRSNVFDYSLYASGQIDEYSDIRAGVRSMGAENGFYLDRDTTFDITINRKISAKANLAVNYARTIRNSRTPGSEVPTKTSSNRLNADLTWDAGKLGIVRLSHEMMMLDPIDRLLLAEVDQNFFTEPIYSKNIRLTLDRSQRPIKGFTVSPNVGYRYGGDNKGLNFGLNLGYMFRSGRQIMLSYAYNSSFGKYMTGALSFGGNKSHSLSFNFVDNLGFGASKGLLSNNTFQSNFDPNSGVIKGSVFLDLNKNGLKDEGEEGVPDVEINFQNLFNVTTDKEGNFIAANIPSGLRKLGVNKDTLPVIYSPTVADALVNVKKEKVYVANLGVIVTPGSVTGKVEVTKEGLSNTNVILLLLDKDGKEVKYTSTDSTGGYFIGSIAPGEYTIAVDKNYLDFKGLQQADLEPKKVTIPMVTDDFVDIKGIDLKLIPKQGEVKKF